MSSSDHFITHISTNSFRSRSESTRCSRLAGSALERNDCSSSVVGSVPQMSRLTRRMNSFFDSFSSWFLFVVLLISSVIMIYSYFYIAPYYKSTYFLSLTVLFVLSMCLVISVSNLFFVILGWDGLGLVSFFLIVYYQNQSSIFSGVITLLINRIGDSFFLCTIALYSYSIYEYYVFSSVFPSLICIILIVITFMTKSAIYPFSPWLPMAMAAPTPISALVHSSTLVTSGLFLIIKYSYFIYSSYSLCLVMVCFCMFTSFYAGINTLFEKDLKKLIALSTLRHLGFIGMSFFLGLLSLSFFHLLSHALFKSLLFITIGDIIINLSHSQDIRFLSSGSLYTPFSCFMILVPLVNLIGVPSLVGFFSKDLVLESTNYTFLGSFMYLVLIINLLFTFYYSFQLFYYSFSANKVSSYLAFHYPILLHSALILFLSSFSLVFGYFYLSVISYSLLFVPLPPFTKLLPMLFMLLFFMFLLIFLRLPTSTRQSVNTYFSSIMFLYPLFTKLTRSIYYSFTFRFVKKVESGILDSTFNLKMPTFFYSLGGTFFKFSILNPFFLSLFFFSSFFFFCFIFVFLRSIKFSRRYKFYYRNIKLFSRLHDAYFDLYFIFCFLCFRLSYV